MTGLPAVRGGKQRCAAAQALHLVSSRVTANSLTTAPAHPAGLPRPAAPARSSAHIRLLQRRYHAACCLTEAEAVSCPVSGHTPCCAAAHSGHDGEGPGLPCGLRGERTRLSARSACADRHGDGGRQAAADHVAQGGALAAQRLPEPRFCLPGARLEALRAAPGAPHALGCLLQVELGVMGSDAKLCMQTAAASLRRSAQRSEMRRCCSRTCSGRGTCALSTS